MGLNVPFWNPRIGDQNLTAALLSQILGNTAGAVSNTAITTVGNGTLTAAALIGGQVTRTGPTGVYTDTTDTAANIVTAFGSFVSGATFSTRIKNGTQYVQTLAAGTGVTLPASVSVPPFSAATYFGTVGGTAASPTVTFTHSDTTAINVSAATVSPQSVALNTVGAATITPAGMNAGVTTRGGTQTAGFTDTTDTAANILAGITSLLGDGSSAEWTYVNNTVWPATLAAGSGVTVSGQTIIPAKSWARYLISRTSSSAVVLTCIGQGYFAHSGTFVANGTSAVTVTDANITASSVISYGINTIGGTPAGSPYMATSTPGTGFTVKAAAGDTSTYNYTILG